MLNSCEIRSFIPNCSRYLPLSASPPSPSPIKGEGEPNLTWMGRMDGISGRGLLRDCHVAVFLAMTKWVRVRVQGTFKVVEIKHPLVLSLSKDGRRWFDKFTMSGGRRTLKRPW